MQHYRPSGSIWKDLGPTEVWQSKSVNVKNEDGSVVTRLLTLEDLELRVKRLKGEEYEEDCTCDSEFMAEVLPEIGAEIRQIYTDNGTDEDRPIYLVMDNAGGHGTKDCIDEYVDMLWNQYKIKVIWQEPRSPETNLLDLGVWASIQSFVEKLHRGKRSDVNTLAHTIETAWNNYASEGVFERVYQRWVTVLGIIDRTEGNNEEVDNRKKEFLTALFQPPQTPDEPADDADEDSDVEEV
jgi:hypothetical protein